MTLLESLGVAMPQTGSAVGDAALRVGSDPLTIGMLAALALNRLRARVPSEAIGAATGDMTKLLGDDVSLPLPARVSEAVDVRARDAAGKWLESLMNQGIPSDAIDLSYLSRGMPPVTNPLLGLPLPEIRRLVRQQSLNDFAFGPVAGEPLPLPPWRSPIDEHFIQHFGGDEFQKRLAAAWEIASARSPEAAAKVRYLGFEPDAEAAWRGDEEALLVNPIAGKKPWRTLEGTLAHELVHTLQPEFRVTRKNLLNVPTMLYDTEVPAYMASDTADALAILYRQAAAQNALDALNRWRNLEVAGLGAGAGWSAFMGGDE